MTVLLETRNLCKHFDGLTVTDMLNISVEANEIHALIGPNGAGKTTLLAQLSGALATNSGSIFLLGKEITRLTTHRRVALGLARSFQITSLFMGFTAIDNIAFAVQAHSGSSFRFWRPVTTETALLSAARAALTEIGLDHRKNSLAVNLGHGEQRQLEIGLALATRPKLLLLDEPMAGLAGEDSARMVKLIQSLKGKISILLVEHDMDVVFQLADRISVLVAGRIIATGTPDEVRSHGEVRRAYLGDIPRGVGRS